MPFECFAQVSGFIPLGIIEADDEDEAHKKASESKKYKISLCNQFSEIYFEVDGTEVNEVKDGED